MFNAQIGLNNNQQKKRRKRREKQIYKEQDKHPYFYCSINSPAGGSDVLPAKLKLFYNCQMN